jgi:hypothetical protein
VRGGRKTAPEEAQVDLPKTLEANGHTWEIKADDAVLAGQNLLGQTNHRDLQIALRTNMPLSQQAETLLHEVIHIVVDGVRNSPISLKEYAVEHLADRLYDVLKANPRVRHFIWPEHEPSGETGELTELTELTELVSDEA